MTSSVSVLSRAQVGQGFAVPGVNVSRTGSVCGGAAVTVAVNAPVS